MTAEVSNIPLSIDYTSRDYYSIREDLINLVKQRVNQPGVRNWSGESSSDFGVALIEAFSYVGDLTNYYIDRIANETYLPTASQRRSIINLARLYGYTPTGFRAATLQVTFSNLYSVDITTATVVSSVITYTAPNHIVRVGDKVTITGMTPSGYNQAEQTVTAVTTDTFSISGTVSGSVTVGGKAGKSFSIPQGTQVSGTVVIDELVEEVIFTTLQEAILPPNGSVQVWSEHGENIALRAENISEDVSGELLGTSSGLPNQLFALSENEVVESTLEVYVQSGDFYQLWTKVNQLTDFGPFDAVYSTEIDENNFVYVSFGDGISGFIPNKTSGIKAVYRVGGGTIGNIGSDVIDTIEKIPGFTQAEVAVFSSYVIVRNPGDNFSPTSVGVGGAEPEDNRSIRINASASLRSANRAISLKDYEDLALSVDNVGKAKAVADIWTSVTLYVAPIRNLNDLDVYPGRTSGNGDVTSEWVTLELETKKFFEDKTLLGSSLTVAPPVYIPIFVGVVFTRNEQFTAEQTADDIKQTLINDFSYAYLSFGQVITPEQISGVLNRLRSVKTARVVSLYRVGSPVVLSTLVASPSEIFVFQESGLAISELTNNADLSGLTSTPSTTFVPTFSAPQAFYNISVANGTETITITPTVTGTGKTIRVNGVLTASGTASGAIDTDPGITQILITVTAADGFTSKVYTVNVSRAS
jgi:hypothetical protein